MARIDYPRREELPSDTCDALNSFPAPLNLFKMVANAPALARPVIDMAVTLLTKLEIDGRLRELVVMYVARHCGATYMWTQHVPIAEAAGLTQAEIAALERRTPTAACFEPRARCALAVVDYVAGGQQCPPEKFAELRASLTPQEIVELLVLAGYYVLLARLMTVLEIDIDPSGGKIAAFINIPHQPIPVSS